MVLVDACAKSSQHRQTNIEDAASRYIQAKFCSRSHSAGTIRCVRDVFMNENDSGTRLRSQDASTRRSNRAAET
jgi:hypothetical protein